MGDDGFCIVFVDWGVWGECHGGGCSSSKGGGVVCEAICVPNTGDRHSQHPILLESGTLRVLNQEMEVKECTTDPSVSQSGQVEKTNRDEHKESTLNHENRSTHHSHMA